VKTLPWQDSWQITYKRSKCYNDPDSFCISVVALLDYLEEVTSILLPKEFNLLFSEYCWVIRTKSVLLTKCAQLVLKHRGRGPKEKFPSSYMVGQWFKLGLVYPGNWEYFCYPISGYFLPVTRLIMMCFTLFQRCAKLLTTVYEVLQYLLSNLLLEADKARCCRNFLTTKWFH